MSTSYVGSDALASNVTPLTIPGFDVLQPYSYAATTSATAANTLASTGASSSDGLNQYQQAVANLDQWQSQILQESLSGNTSAASSALYASAGLSADQFANLATELQNLQSTSPSGNIVDTSA